MTTWVPPPQYHPSKMEPRLHTDVIYTLNQGADTYNRNMTYRFRVLNAHYDNAYNNVTFAVYYNNVTLPNGTVVAQEINPYNLSFPLTSYQTQVNFTVIGTDSALFNKPVNNVNQFDMGVAERVELLIKFGPENGIPLNVNNVYLICYDVNYAGSVVKYRFQLNQVVAPNKYADPVKTLPLPVPFTDLTTIPKSQIVANRMRPLLSRPSDQKFVINGHYMFNMGETDNPKIGTVEDWYIVNNLFEPHPIHVHLINFQVVQTYDLKITPFGCTVYELDFFRFSNYSAFNGLSDEDLCYYLGNITLEESTMLYHFLGTYNLETKFTSTNIGPVSGLNAMDPIASSADMAKYAQYSNCPYNSLYKYVCNNSTSTINSWYKRWKETAFVRQYTVMVLRIRWASTNYDPTVKPYPYFAVPEDQLMEFPGFVYHCHILPHEDNEMMRPYMLSPSDKYIQQAINQTTTSNYNNLLSTVQAQNLNINSIVLNPIQTTSQSFLPQNWYQKAKQINTFLSCPA
jgi:FtsP/CotA-like multicopper oxidase with cupredoxin domain